METIASVLSRFCESVGASRFALAFRHKSSRELCETTLSVCVSAATVVHF